MSASDHRRPFVEHFYVLPIVEYRHILREGVEALPYIANQPFAFRIRGGAVVCRGRFGLGSGLRFAIVFLCTVRSWASPSRHSECRGSPYASQQV